MRYRHVWPGVLLLSSLAVLLVALLVWGDHFLSPGPSGGLSRLLETWVEPRVLEVAASAPARDESRSRSPEAVDGPPSPLGDTSPWIPEPPQSSSPSRSSVIREVKAAATRATVEPRYALDLGMFRLADEAERIEAQLNQAGFSTVRFRQQEPARLWSVYLPLPREPEEAQAVVARLREDGFADAVVTAGAQAAVQITRGMPLRTAVRIAERLRSRGYDSRVAAEAPRAGQVALRHGNFTSREEAEAVGRELSRLGVATEVVQIR